MEKKFVKPNVGGEGKKPLLVRHPVTKQPLAADGEWVELDTYWVRRLAHGDVVEATPPASPAENKSKNKKDSKEDK